MNKYIFLALLVGVFFSEIYGGDTQYSKHNVDQLLIMPAAALLSNYNQKRAAKFSRKANKFNYTLTILTATSATIERTGKQSAFDGDICFNSMITDGPELIDGKADETLLTRWKENGVDMCTFSLTFPIRWDDNKKHFVPLTLAEKDQATKAVKKEEHKSE